MTRRTEQQKWLGDAANAWLALGVVKWELVRCVTSSDVCRTDISFLAAFESSSELAQCLQGLAKEPEERRLAVVRELLRMRARCVREVNAAMEWTSSWGGSVTVPKLARSASEEYIQAAERLHSLCGHILRAFDAFAREKNKT